MAQAAREFVLVHGAAHGAWCWDAVARRLEARGHRVVTLDLPGHGRRAAEAGRASVGAYASAVADAMARDGVSRRIVVDLDTDRDAMLSAPDQLARILERI